MTRGRGGVTIPPKIDDVIYEQPLREIWLDVERFCNFDKNDKSKSNKQKQQAEAYFLAYVRGRGRRRS